MDKETHQLVEKIPYLLKKEVLLTGDTLTEAKVNIDQRFNEPYVSMRFNATGAKIFEDVTGANVGKMLAIILDGTVYSAPRIKGQDQRRRCPDIRQFLLLDEAKDLAIVLRAGALPAPLKTLQNLT